ncbi:B12-binding domain-containing radical SAM protein [Candidatus Gottesmanbacteria bacterium]|nr:B12-binding domain-containing radical SAM protein [Candidatus Gottesmanbacteria bacterium]
MSVSKQNKPNVILLYPKTGLDLASTIAPPHALLAIAAPADKAGYNIRIIDQRIEKITEYSLKELISSDLICVGISTMTGTQIRNSLDLAKIVRKLTNAPIVWGGTHPTITAEQTLANEYVDIVVVGEGDITFIELIRALENKQSLREIKGIVYMDGGKPVATEKRPLLNIEELLSTPWGLIDVEKYIHKNKDMYLKDRFRVLDLGQTSRGCPFNCGFCSSSSIRDRKWRALSAENSFNMIKENVNRFNLDGFWLRDDEFYINRKRAHNICESIIEANLDVRFYTSGTRVDVFMRASHEELATLKRAGADTLKFGAESGSNRILKLMQKGVTVEETLAANRRCMEYDFIPAFALMMGYPTETMEEINMTIDLAYSLKKENPKAHIETIASYTAHPGTPDFNLALKHGLHPPHSLDGWTNWVLDDYDLKGEKLPWYNEKERIYIGNISLMSILADSSEGIVKSFGFSNRLIGKLLKLCAQLSSKYFHMRLSNKRYKFAPELKMFQFLRQSLFRSKSA